MEKKSLEEAINSRPSYKELLKECIKEEEGEIVVNWGRIHKEDFESPIEDIKEKACYVLHDIGIMSANSKGNYLVTGSGVSLNPHLMYFTRKKDAIDYKKAFYGGAQYSVKIFKGEN